MNSANSLANGGKLDDCHSSIYSLAKLECLRWRTFSGSLSLPTSPSEDPILDAFGRCLSQDIVAVWRRKPKKVSSSMGHGTCNDNGINSASDIKKELWIFWWGDEHEPSVAAIGNTSGLILESESSWEDQGLSYECRTLLFKAIHNLIEKCLLLKGFVRIGKWFVQPHKKEVDGSKCQRLSISFMFFVRGEQWICTTVDIAQHQPVENINSHQITPSREVVLSPYGLRAILSGVSFKSPNDAAVRTVMNEWGIFYPIKYFEDHGGGENPVPPVVEVLLCGVRMNYPSSYILVPFDNHSASKESDQRAPGWIGEKRGGMDNSSHQGDFPSIGSIQDSIGMSASEMITSPLSESQHNQSMTETTASLVKKLLNRVVTSSQLATENEVNGVLHHSDNHMSADNHSNWPKLSCQFRKARHKNLNYQPRGDEDVSQVSVRQKYIGDSLSQVDARRKGEKQKHLANIPFHRGSVDANATSSTTQAPIPPSVSSHEGNPMMSMYPTQPANFMSYPPFGIGQEEIPKSVEMQNPVEPIFYSNTNNEGPHAAENFQANGEIDPGGFQYRITDKVVGSSSVGEIKEEISLWKKIKLPKDMAKQQKSVENGAMNLERPSLVQENLESESSAFCPAIRSMKSSKSSLTRIQNDLSWPVGSRKRKAEDEPNTLDIPDASHANPNVVNGVTPKLLSHHVRVGSVSGSLAGMAVSSDPYEFEDNDKESDSAPSFTWPNADNDPMSNLNSKNLNITTLLKQSSQDRTLNRGMPGFDEIAGLDKPSSSLKEKEDLKVSPFDLVNIFEDESISERNVKTEKGVDNSLGNHGMFPTAESLNPFQSGNSRYSHHDGTIVALSQIPNNSQSNAAISIGALGSLAGKMAGTIHGYGRIFDDETTEQSEVFSKQPLSKQPLTSKYAPLSIKTLSKNYLENKTLRWTYTPSWQMGMRIDPFPMENHDDSAFLQNADAQTPAPHSYSVSTPASVPMQSPAPQQMPRTPRTPRTPRPGPSPATSTPNPATHGRFSAQTPQTSVSSSVAHSDVGNCRASSIYVNLMLSDSVLNLFRDISFDQCPMCVCNDNIRSRDVELGFIPSMTDNTSDGQFPCSCGFSAVRNRNLSIGAGLFLEDELEIAGKELENLIIKSRDALRKSSDRAIEPTMSLAIQQAPNPYFKLNVDSSVTAGKNSVYNIAAQLDIREACVDAINGGITVMETATQPKIRLDNCRNIIHGWTDSRFMKNPSSSDMYQMMLNLQPTLQDAIQNIKQERSYHFVQRVQGPLTWLEFCKDSNSGNTGSSGPLPVPMLLVGQNLDWATVSPFALDYWEKLYLEPYGGKTNISFLALCPEIEHVVSATKFFFVELSQAYDLCRLGTLKPLGRSDNGVFCVSKSKVLNNFNASESGRAQADSTGQLPASNHIGASSFTKTVERYVSACRNTLFPLFNIDLPYQNCDAPSSEDHSSQMPDTMLNSISKPGYPCPNPVQDKIKNTKEAFVQFKKPTSSGNMLVLYFIDPFIGDECASFSIAVWQFFSEIVKTLPECKKNSIAFQIVTLDDILHNAGSTHKSSVSAARSLAFSSYFQCRHRINCQSFDRTMTVFGPAATLSEAVKKGKIKLSLPVHSPAYILAGSKNNQKNLLIMDKRMKECNILYVTYCLSHDQKWLIASATDQDGELLETFCVNIDVPPRRVSLKKKQRICISRTEAIQKLWKLCLGLVTSTASIRWRIVIGRLGRLGHGEIQEWCKYLNRRNFVQMSKLVSAKCNQCQVNGANKHPSIYSACLISMEPEGAFTILPDSVVKITLFGRNERSGQQVQLKTPEDASCTHIYVFPTSSFVQTSSGAFPNENLDLLNGFSLPLGEDNDIIEGMNDIFSVPSPTGNPHQTDDAGHMRQQPDRLMSTDLTEEIVLQQQPLALGYYVSTAPTGPLPDTFWASCPHAQNKCPVFLKFALHIQVGSEEVTNMGGGDTNDEHHKLDSRITAEVLRYVMENYNALSWLTCDPVSQDRRSCLPIHYFVLARLYHTIKEMT